MGAADSHEGDLLPRIARGDADAVRACLDRYSPLVWSIARKLGSDANVAEDVVQEVFIDLWKSAARFDAAKASETTFVATVARRRVIDRRRRMSAAPEQQDIADVERGASDPRIQAVDQSDEVRRARETLAQLKPEQQKVILMSVVDQLTHQEIAETTGMPLGTVKSHIRRGLDKAAQLLRASRRPSKGGSPA